MQLTLDARQSNFFPIIVSDDISDIFIRNGSGGQILQLLFQQDATSHTVSAGTGNIAGFDIPLKAPGAQSTQSFLYDQLTNTWLAATRGNGKITKAITSAQLLAIQATPVVLLPAPGVGFVYDVLHCSAQFKHGTVPYTPFDGTALLTVQYQGDLVNLFGAFVEQGFIDQTTDQFWPTCGFFGLQGGGATPISTCGNAPITLGSNEASPTLGNGSLLIHLQYEIIQLG